MKETRAPLRLPALILAALILSAPPRAAAADAQSKEVATAMLISAPWRMSCEYWFKICNFAKDGTFTIKGWDDEPGTWAIANNLVTLTYKDGHTETLTLPLNPKGTGGLDKDGNITTSFTQAPPLAMPPIINAQATTALLCSGPWRVKGSWWRGMRTFKKDGTFAGGEAGTWKIASNMIVLTFPDGHNDEFMLPLDPKGTDGADSNGHPTCETLIDPAAEKLEDKANVASRAAKAGLTPPGTAAASKPARPAATPGSVFGSTQPGVSDTAPAPASTGAALSPEMQQKAADLVKTYHNDLVFVTGKEGAGSGFIAAIGKSNFLITNAHVTAGINDAAFKTLGDDTVQTGAATVAVGRDIFCMAVAAGGTPLEIMQDVDGNAGIGDEVVVLGNAEGGGVINTITGRIVGIGPDRVEVDAPFVPGNSGSPIIHLKSGKVIGVATYLTINNYDAATKEKIAAPVIRRFGYRLDNVKGWQTVDWRTYRAQAAGMEQIEKLTDDLYDFFRDLIENDGKITPDRHTNPIIKNRITQWIADRGGNRSATDRQMADENFLSFLKDAAQNDVTAARRQMGYDYFQRQLATQQQDRDEMSKAFEQLIKNLHN